MLGRLVRLCQNRQLATYNQQLSIAFWQQSIVVNEKAYGYRILQDLSRCCCVSLTIGFADREHDQMPGG
jgi:hypothetical protein